jgi:signal transduction histidine kinase
MIPLIFIAIFFSIKRTTLAALGILTLVGILLSFMDHSPENLPYWNLRNIWYFLMLATGLILTFMRHLSNLEQIRQMELKRINEQLEHKVAELERFTYTVSHELKNPVVTIKGFLGSVENDIRSGNYEKAQKDFRRITNATDNLNNTLSDLLKLSRIGNITPSFEEFSLFDLIHEVVKVLEEKLRSKNITINISPTLPIIYCDRARLGEVFENLIDNAAKYMGDQSTPHIEIGQRPEKDPIFYVKDNGMGIEPQFQTRIFGLFEKLNTTSEGTGIGLAIVKRSIETRGGRVWVESDGLGKGSTFCFTIPDIKK